MDDHQRLIHIQLDDQDHVRQRQHHYTHIEEREYVYLKGQLMLSQYVIFQAKRNVTYVNVQLHVQPYVDLRSRMHIIHHLNVVDQY